MGSHIFQILGDKKILVSKDLKICGLAVKKVVIVFNAQLDNASRERNIIKIPKLENLHGWSVTEDICPETLLPSLLLQTSLEL